MTDLTHMRDGTDVEDPRLGRLIQFDRKSLAFPIIRQEDDRPLRSMTWRLRPDRLINQGNIGACVGCSLTQRLATWAIEAPAVGYDFAMTLYRTAQMHDPWPGEQYEGTSLLAGLQVLHRWGWIRRYEWSFSLRQLQLGLGYHGAAVLGIPWYDGMFYPSSDGRVRPTGHIAGGHAIEASAIDVDDQKIWFPNTWGDWGLNGWCWMHFDDVDRLLHERGEAAFLSGRRKPLPTT